MPDQRPTLQRQKQWQFSVTESDHSQKVTNLFRTIDVCTLYAHIWTSMRFKGIVMRVNRKFKFLAKKRKRIKLGQWLWLLLIYFVLSNVKREASGCPHNSVKLEISTTIMLETFTLPSDGHKLRNKNQEVRSAPPGAVSTKLSSAGVLLNLMNCTKFHVDRLRS